MFTSFTNLLTAAYSPKIYEIKPTVIYARASTKEQNTEAQIYTCSQFCQSSNLEIIETVVEKCSAYKFVSQSKLEDILSKHSNINLVVSSADRLSRNVIKADGILEIFIQKNITLISCKEKINTGTAYGRHEFRTIISASQYESELISERVKNSVNYRKANGIHIGKPRYGFIILDKKLVKCHEEQEVIKFICKIAKKKFQISKVSEHLRHVLVNIGREYEYSPVIITIEDQNEEYTILDEYTTISVTFQTVCEILNDYGFTYKGKKWTRVNVGNIYKTASEINIQGLTI